MRTINIGPVMNECSSPITTLRAAYWLSSHHQTRSSGKWATMAKGDHDSLIGCGDGSGLEEVRCSDSLRKHLGDRRAFIKLFITSLLLALWVLLVGLVGHVLYTRLSHRLCPSCITVSP